MFYLEDYFSKLLSSLPSIICKGKSITPKVSSIADCLKFDILEQKSHLLGVTYTDCCAFLLNKGKQSRSPWSSDTIASRQSPQLICYLSNFPAQNRRISIFIVQQFSNYRFCSISYAILLK